MKHKNLGFQIIKRFSLVPLFIFIAWSTLAIAQDTFPSRPITIVVPSPPGGSTDIAVRIVASQLPNELGGSVIVLNKKGRGVGAVFVKDSKPDGYTLLGPPISFLTIPILDRKCPYTVADFDPICIFDLQASVIGVRNESPFKTIKEVIDFAKSNPGKLSYGSAGVGSSSHFFGESFKQSVGLDITHVPFLGDPSIFTAAIGGHVDLGVGTLPGAFALIKGGKIRGLCVGSKERSPFFLEIPSLAEIGYPDVGFDSFHAFLGPKGIPKPVMEKLSAAFERAVKHPSVQTKLSQITLTPIYISPEEFKEFIKKETEKFTRIAQKAGMIVH